MYLKSFKIIETEQQIRVDTWTEKIRKSCQRKLLKRCQGSWMESMYISVYKTGLMKVSFYCTYFI